jgi:hypothetical protein
MFFQSCENMKAGHYINAEETTMTNLQVGVGQAARILNYSTVWIKQNEAQLGLTPTYTGGGHRRYELTQLLEAAKLLEARKKHPPAKC